MSAFEADRFNHSRTSPRRTNFLFVQPNAFYQVEYRAFARDWRDKSCSVLLHDHGVNKINHVGTAAFGCPASLLAGLELLSTLRFVKQSHPIFLQSSGKPRAAVPTLAKVQ